jgi:hypothetical protein
MPDDAPVTRAVPRLLAMDFDLLGTCRMRGRLLATSLMCNGHRKFFDRHLPDSPRTGDRRRWGSILILRDAGLGMTRFDQFRASLGIAPNILARRLQKLTQAGLLINFVETLGGQLMLFFLPPYSPDRNPDELVWKHLKADTVGRMAATSKVDFKEKVVASMRSLQKRPDKISAFYQKPSLRYAA